MQLMEVFENTDLYGILCFNNGVSFAMFNKKRQRSLHVSGANAVDFANEYANLLTLWLSVGSVYYSVSKNQVLANLFDRFDHLAEPYALDNPALAHLATKMH